SSDPFFSWYHSPLSLEDWTAGGSLLILCFIFIPLTALVAFIMYRADKEIIGYRYLVSASLADILCMVQYGGFNGIAILAKNRLADTGGGRSAMQLYIDWAWFACCLHYPLVAWSRFAAIKTPMWFCRQERHHSYAICLLPYLLALILVCSTHWASFYTRFYFEPAVYGMLAEDFSKWTIALLVRDRNANGVVGVSKGQMSVEKRLMFPCILGNVIFVLGQVAITIGTGTGKWATWLICLLFFINSAANAVLLLLFSPNLRASVLQGGKQVKMFERTTISVTRV
ncbi:hypothetical protein PFISCL1PPCAC_1186, partial [Pristionchus fissidentatus]